MATNRIVLNETSYFGAGSRAVLADEIQARGYKKAFIVTDTFLYKNGYTKPICTFRSLSSSNSSQNFPGADSSRTIL